MSNRLRLLCAIASCLAGAVTASAFDANYYATSSRLASGKWVKVAVVDEGIYQISYDQLRQWGFSDPSKVCVYGYGAAPLMSHEYSTAQPDDVQPTPTYHTEDGRILFYGHGIARPKVTTWTTGVPSKYVADRTRDVYDNVDCYFLSDANPDDLGYQSDAYVTPTYAKPVLSHLHIDYVEEDNHMFIPGGISTHGKQFSAGDKIPYEFEIRNFEPFDKYSSGFFSYKVAIASDTQATLGVTGTASGWIFKTAQNIKALAIAEYTRFAYATGAHEFYPSTSTTDRSSKLGFTVDIANISGISYVAADAAYFVYPRSNKVDAQDPSVIMTYESNQVNKGTELMFADTDRDIQLWLLPDDYSVRPVSGKYDAGKNSLSFTAPVATTRAVAFLPEGDYPDVTYVGDVSNQDLHALATPELLIITTRTLQPYAQELAAMHERYQGMSAAVVCQEDIFNEFSSGSRNIMAYRRFAKMLYDRAPGTMKHILLYGTGSYDNRQIQIPSGDLLLTYQTTEETNTRNSVKNYTSDAIMAMLEDGYKHAEIYKTPLSLNIGRIPAISVENALAYNNKARNWFTNPTPPQVFYNALLLSGNGNLNEHGKHSKEVKAALAAASENFCFNEVHEKVHTEGTTQDMVRDFLTNGMGYMTFSGHGDKVSAFNMWSVNLAMTNKYEYPTFAMISSCGQYQFDALMPGLIESMLFVEDGGCIAGVAAAREVYLAQNQHTNLPVGMAYGAARHGWTIGDVFREARILIISRTNGSKTACENNMSYNLAGDPALPLYVPEYSAVVKSIGGMSPESAFMSSYEPCTIEGYITNASGTINTSFNGVAHITLYDGAHVEQSKNTANESGFTPEDYNIESEIMTEVDAVVTNGKFTVTLTPRVPNYTADNYKMTISAIDSSSPSTGAMGVTHVLIKKAESGEIVAEAPVINDFYAGDGGERLTEVPSTFTINAVIDPSASGLYLGTSGIATRASVYIDGTLYSSDLRRFFSVDADGQAIFSMDIADQTDGPHSIQLTVVSNSGGVDRATIDVMVVSRNISATLTVAEEPARTVATIESDDCSGNVEQLHITDHFGKSVFTARNVSLPYQWNLKDNDGKLVPDGRYKVSVLLHDDRNYGHSEATEIVVVK